jgi:hypothetical protein
MSDDTATTIDEAAITEAAEKWIPHLEEAQKMGLNFRQITGGVLRDGDRIGVDIDFVGEQGFDGGGLEDDKFFDQLMLACWLLCEEPDQISQAIAGGEKATSLALRRWQTEHMFSIRAEVTAMKAFLARWIEHRLEMAVVFAEEGEEESGEK